MAFITLAFPNGALASITYDVSIDTSKLPAGNYQAAFFLIDPAAPDNFSQAKLPVSFSIDGDIISDSTHYYADQPTLDPVPSPIPINFYLTLQGAAGSSDYFLMAVRTPDGGMLAAPDGNEWLAWAAMNVDSPTLNLDLPNDVRISSAVVPEPLPVVLMLLGILHISSSVAGGPRK